MKQYLKHVGLTAVGLLLVGSVWLNYDQAKQIDEMNANREQFTYTDQPTIVKACTKVSTPNGNTVRGELLVREGRIVEAHVAGDVYTLIDIKSTEPGSDLGTYAHHGAQHFNPSKLYRFDNCDM